MSQSIQIAGVSVQTGERRRFEIPIARLPTETWLSIPVEVVSGAQPGPRLWLSAAVHGDELNGVEIIRQVLREITPQDLQGTVIAVPIVNVFGFINRSRYLPDRRDLNRSFPGSPRGSMASRLAALFMEEVVSQCTHGIDIHTGSNHRVNLPQIRANLQDNETRRCAKAFGAPVMIDSHTRDGSLREAATQRGIHILLYEAGESFRFDSESIALGVEGILRVMSTLKMRKHRSKKKKYKSVFCTQGNWIRARRSGILRLEVNLGDHVEKRQRLGVIADAFGDNRVSVNANYDGIIVGHTNSPLVNQGDGIVHIASIDQSEK